MKYDYVNRKMKLRNNSKSLAQTWHARIGFIAPDIIISTIQYHTHVTPRQGRLVTPDTVKEKRAHVSSRSKSIIAKPRRARAGANPKSLNLYPIKFQRTI